MKNYNIERGECQKTQTNFLLLNKESTVYSVHCAVAVVVLYIAFINEHTKVDMGQPKSWVLHVLMGILSVALIAQAGFPEVNYKAQKCAQPRDPSVVWTDNSKYWFHDPFFLIMVLFSLMYGLGTVASPGQNAHIVEKILCFDPSKLLPKENSVAEIVARIVAVLPTASFIYYFVWKVILKGELVKPVQSDMHIWEAPLAATFSLVFIPFGLYTIFGSKLFDDSNQILAWIRRFFTLRILAVVFLFAAFYVFVWRLQGGLFLNKADYRKLKNQVKQARESQVGLPVSHNSVAAASPTAAVSSMAAASS